MNLQDRLLTAVRTHHLIPAGSRIVVGVSGGTDSLALMHLLAALRERLNCSLHVATLDHGLRGDAGADDVRFVADTAQAWGLEVTAGYVDVRALAHDQRLSTEAAARLARYDFLAAVAQEHGAERVAVAHHADDQVETILLHLLRGSSLSGLSGMSSSAPVPGHPELTLIRPLLGIHHSALSAYCRAHTLLSRHDTTNDDLTMLRNRLRRETIPYLRELSPQVERRLLQLGEIAALESEFADAELHSAIDPHVVHAAGRVSLPRAVFGGLHPALRRRFVLWAVGELGEASDVGFIHVATAVELAVRGQVGARAQLKGGVQLRIGYGVVFIEREDAPLTYDVPLLPLGAMLPVAVPGETPVDAQWTLRASLDYEPGATQFAIPEGSSIILRGRQEGDRFAPPGLNGSTKKLNDWLIDRKIPRPLRDQLPLLVVDDQLAAVYWNGWFPAYPFAVKPDTHRVVYVRFARQQPE